VTGAEVAARLGLERHPEGGRFRENFRDTASTAIYFLLERGEVSRWHRVAQAEAWHFYAGAPLELRIDRATYRLGADLAAGERPQIVVPPRAWQSARSLGDWTLVGCTVAPPFSYDTFEMAPEGWEPPS
jgi:predicted cupin superfamily sugar epimerase